MKTDVPAQGNHGGKAVSTIYLLFLLASQLAASPEKQSIFMNSRLGSEFFEQSLPLLGLGLRKLRPVLFESLPFQQVMFQDDPIGNH